MAQETRVQSAQRKRNDSQAARDALAKAFAIARDQLTAQERTYLQDAIASADRSVERWNKELAERNTREQLPKMYYRPIKLTKSRKFKNYELEIAYTKDKDADGKYWVYVKVYDRGGVGGFNFRHVRAYEWISRKTKRGKSGTIALADKLYEQTRQKRTWTMTGTDGLDMTEVS